MKKRMELYMAVLLLVAVCLLSKEGAVLVSSMRAAEEKPCIVVDAGHGGDDPGKIGIHGELEKDINLAIAKKVKARLEKENITVILTRETDESLDKGESGSKKVADMRNRCRLIDEAKPLFTISVHQNSYTEESISPRRAEKLPGLCRKACGRIWIRKISGKQKPMRVIIS